MKIKKGATRCVFVTKKYALKIPRLFSWKNFLYGLLANMQEVEFRRFDRLLCPILFYLPFGFLVVMPTCKELKSSVTREKLRKIVKKAEKSRKIGLPVEIKQSSFGTLNGKLVIIDYGS